MCAQSTKKQKNTLTKDNLYHVDKSKSNTIDSLMKASHSNGILIRDNVIIKHWEYDKNINQKIEVQSITKSIISLLLGIAIDKGLISNINDKVIKYYPQFDAGKYSNEITFKHLVTVSSGIKATKFKENYGNHNDMPPGLDARYHNDHFDLLAKALTFIYDKPLLEVLKTNVLNPLDINIEWSIDGEVLSSDGKTIPVYAGYAFTKWTAGDLAKIGLLYLQNGKWEDKQIISQKYIQESLTPISIPLMVSRPNQDVRIDSNNTYGYGWRAKKSPNGAYIWHMSGNGGQFCVLIPEKNMVFVKINGYSEKYKPYRRLDQFLDLLLAQ
ncbi:serine hydrolase domain-containing protein [Sphingobacterium rhinopitheci]|uniref:serine hydrolase domain-containing protein n=1 Tax=Sphingobacterium rhinopitheci TaxID=2781960 RepID=UPI001F51AFB4|nr:serine hydrolase [Sphingobacterium rhinopitheci]MCI0921420.1 serine hydrolase [Sphingobacterium rhinopitheci]